MERKKLGLFVLFVSIVASSIWASDWWITTVDTTHNSGIYGTSIALDSLGIPHLAYCRYNAGGLVYASFNSLDSTWSYEVVFDSAGGKIAGTAPSLALDSKGYPHISFWWGDLGYAWKDSTGWHTIHPYTERWIEYTSLKLDKNDYPHIGHTGVIHWTPDTSVVLYTYWDGKGWHTETVDTVVYSDVSLALDSDDCPYIAYANRGSRGIRCAKRKNGVWHIEIVDTLDTTDCYCDWFSIAINNLCYPCIAYSCYGEERQDLRYAVRVDTGWRIEIVDTMGCAGSETCLWLDVENIPHISYVSDWSWLKYAWRDGDDRWYIDEIDSVGTAEWGRYWGYTGLALDKDEYAHISYYNHIEGCIMKYARGYPTGIEERLKFKSQNSKAKLKLSPNPVRKNVEIRYNLEKESLIDMSIYNVLGQRVITLADGKQSSGAHTVCWALNDSDGKKVKNGIYFCCFRNSAYLVVKVIVVK